MADTHNDLRGGGNRAASFQGRGVTRCVSSRGVPHKSAMYRAAGMLDPLKMRSLDAIHLAAASLIAPALTALVTYDKGMAEGAALLGFPVVSPA